MSVTPKDGYTEVWAQTMDGLESVWRWGREKSERQIHDLCANKGKDSVVRIFQKERKLTETAKTVWFEKEFNSIVGTREVRNVFDNDVFDFPKPLSLMERIINIATEEDSIILDSFAGSGTTAHAVLNLNKADGGNRKFILIEMMDYAEGITAERVRRVIDGYGEGKKAVAGTGGDFSFYELGDPLLLPNGNINEDVGTDKLREYIYFTETQQPLEPLRESEPYYLGTYFAKAYYFCYEKDRRTILDYELLEAAVKTRAEGYVIYADTCTLSESQLEKFNITFKKIPRDITRI